jgi:hypothetical protein
VIAPITISNIVRDPPGDLVVDIDPRFCQPGSNPLHNGVSMHDMDVAPRPRKPGLSDLSTTDRTSPDAALRGPAPGLSDLVMKVTLDSFPSQSPDVSNIVRYPPGDLVVDIAPRPCQPGLSTLHNGVSIHDMDVAPRPCRPGLSDLSPDVALRGAVPGLSNLVTNVTLESGEAPSTKAGCNPQDSDGGY